MTHILMKTHNASCTPVLILHETKPNVVHFSCRKSAYEAEMTISFVFTFRIYLDFTFIFVCVIGSLTDISLLYLIIICCVYLHYTVVKIIHNL